MIDLREVYLKEHSDWRRHYIESMYGGWYLAFKESFMKEYLPKKIKPYSGEDLDQVNIKLLDTEDNNEVFYMKWWLTYENFEKSYDILDMDYNHTKNVWSLMDYIYGSKLCACNIKAGAERAGATIENDECEGNRFVIESITIPDHPELILFSETFTKDQLENILAGKV